MGLILALVALLLVVFGGGIFCGYVVFRGGPSISVTLPDTALAEPIERLQRTIYRFDQQLGRHVERMTLGADELNAAGSTSPQLVKLAVANQEFSKQLKVFAASVRQAGCAVDAIAPDREDRDLAPHPNGASPTAEPKPIESPQSAYRTELRHPFHCKQWIAPYNGSRTPEPEEFVSVQCRDISSGGISFFVDRMPKHEMVVIRLSALNEPKYLTARVQRAVPSPELEHGRYMIGCSFLGTLHRSALPAGLEDSIRRRESRDAAKEMAIA